jgi:hypothetical protein
MKHTLTMSTWVGLGAIALAIIASTQAQVYHASSQIHADVKAIEQKIDTFHNDLHNLHGRTSRMEALVQR